MIPAIVGTTDRLLATGACAVILAFLYLFFFGRRRLSAVAASGEAPEVTVVVEGGYAPELILARRGVPLRLVFDRRESSPCSDEIVFPDFGIRRPLAAHAKTVIEILPERVGDFPFSCGMNMLHGRIRVTP